MRTRNMRRCPDCGHELPATAITQHQQGCRNVKALWGSVEAMAERFRANPDMAINVFIREYEQAFELHTDHRLMAKWLMMGGVTQAEIDGRKRNRGGRVRVEGSQGYVSPPPGAPHCPRCGVKIYTPMIEPGLSGLCLECTRRIARQTLIRRKTRHYAVTGD